MSTFCSLGYPKYYRYPNVHTSLQRKKTRPSDAPMAHKVRSLVHKTIINIGSNPTWTFSCGPFFVSLVIQSIKGILGYIQVFEGRKRRQPTRFLDAPMAHRLRLLVHKTLVSTHGFLFTKVQDDCLRVSSTWFYCRIQTCANSWKKDGQSYTYRIYILLQISTS